MSFSGVSGRLKWCFLTDGIGKGDVQLMIRLISSLADSRRYVELATYKDEDNFVMLRSFAVDVVRATSCGMSVF